MLRGYSSILQLQSPATLFFVSAIWFTWIQKRKQKRDVAAKKSCMNGSSVGLSSRTVLKPTVSYWNGFLLCLQNPCDAEANPEGHIALCLAENKLVQETLANRLMLPGTAQTAFSDEVVYSYNGFLGLPEARQAAAYFLARRFLLARGGGGDVRRQSSSSSELVEPETTPETAAMMINPEHVSLGAGCASLLNNLFFTLAEKGDAVLIPAPYYAAFENDMQAVAGCVPYAVQMENPMNGPTTNDLNAAFEKATKEGLRVKMLLLTNPNDPLGVIYMPHVIYDAVFWARERQLHTVVDEIYALSVHHQVNNFRSVIHILENNLENDVHMLWGLSKDFGASGFRVGVLYTQNENLLAALANLNIFSGVSHPMQMITAELLKDDDFVDSFLLDARAQLNWSYTICTRKLEEMVIPYVPAEAGLFVYADFSSVLPEQTFDGEARFASFMQDVARVVMTPGQSQRDRKPGMFRICYSWVSPGVLEIAMERLSCVVAKIRRYHWDNLDSIILDDVAKV